MSKLAKKERIALAGAFARTNMGMSVPSKSNMQRLLALKDISLSAAVMWFCQDYMETDEHQDMFEQEGAAWYKLLGETSKEDLIKLWPHMAELLVPDQQGAE